MNSPQDSSTLSAHTTENPVPELVANIAASNGPLNPSDLTDHPVDPVQAGQNDVPAPATPATPEPPKPRPVIFKVGENQWIDPKLIDTSLNPFGQERMENLGDLLRDIEVEHLQWPAALVDTTGLAYYGHRRIAAALKAGLKQLRIDVINPLPEKERVLMAIHENDKRRDALWYENGFALKALTDQGVKIKDAVTAFTDKRGRVRKPDWGSTLNLATQFILSNKRGMKYAKAGKIGEREASTLHGLPVEDVDKALDLIDGGASVRETVTEANTQARESGRVDKKVRGLAATGRTAVKGSKASLTASSDAKNAAKKQAPSVGSSPNPVTRLNLKGMTKLVAGMKPFLKKGQTDSSLAVQGIILKVLDSKVMKSKTLAKLVTTAMGETPVDPDAVVVETADKKGGK